MLIDIVIISDNNVCTLLSIFNKWIIVHLLTRTHGLFSDFSTRLRLISQTENNLSTNVGYGMQKHKANIKLSTSELSKCLTVFVW